MGDEVIVCGVDGSPAGQRALEWAIAETVRRGCRLRVVTVWSWDGLARSPEESVRQAGELQRDSVEPMLAGAELGEVERLLLEGSPGDELCAAAADAVLLVLGSHGHGAVHDALAGSTSQHVIRHAPCAVVVLPDPRHAGRRGRRARSSA